MSPPITRMLIASILSLATLRALAADFPLGTYSPNGGKTTVSVDGHGKFTVMNNGKLEVSGNYTVQDDKIQFTDIDGPGACKKDGQQTGTYRWSLENTAVSFKKVADACDDRADVVKGVWKRQP